MGSRTFILPLPSSGPSNSEPFVPSDHRDPAGRFHFREDRKGPEPGGTPRPKPSEETDTEAEKEILCRQCRQGITDPGQIISVQGGHRHTFANPLGVVFEIGCFQAVRNCAAVGPSSGEFTWFSGFRWRVLICGVCLTHLGWMFTSTGPNRFFGLILDRLEFPR